MAGSSQNLGQHYNNSAAASGLSRLPNPATDADREQEVRYFIQEIKKKNIRNVLKTMYRDPAHQNKSMQTR